MRASPTGIALPRCRLALACDDGWAIASHIALSALMSMFPFLILITALAGFFFGSKELADQVATSARAWPKEVAETAREPDRAMC